MNRVALGLDPTPEPRQISLDIERKPMLAKVWGLWDQNIGIHQIIEPSSMVSWAATDASGWKMFRSVYHDGQTKMLNDLWSVLDKADCLITYNGKRFDEKHVRTELLKGGFSPPSPWQSIDLLLLNRKHFAHDSNKLDWVAQMLRVGRKLDYGESHFSLIEGCEAGNEQSLGKLKDYNIQDAQLNLDVYEKIRGWL